MGLLTFGQAAQATGATVTERFLVESKVLSIRIETDGPLTFSGDLIVRAPKSYTTTGTQVESIVVDGDVILGSSQIIVRREGYYTITVVNNSGGNRRWYIHLHTTGDE